MVIDPRTLVLDAGGVLALARDDQRARSVLRKARERRMRVKVSAVTLAEVIRGDGPRDAPVHRTLNHAETVPVSEEIGRVAGKLLADATSDATVDSVVVATALTFPRGAVVLTGDPDDTGRLARAHSLVDVVPV